MDFELRNQEATVASLRATTQRASERLETKTRELERICEGLRANINNFDSLEQRKRHFFLQEEAVLEVMRLSNELQLQERELRFEMEILEEIRPVPEVTPVQPRVPFSAPWFPPLRPSTRSLIFSALDSIKRSHSELYLDESESESEDVMEGGAEPEAENAVEAETENAVELETENAAETVTEEPNPDIMVPDAQGTMDVLLESRRTNIFDRESNSVIEILLEEDDGNPDKIKLRLFQGDQEVPLRYRVDPDDRQTLTLVPVTHGGVLNGWAVPQVPLPVPVEQAEEVVEEVQAVEEVQDVEEVQAVEEQAEEEPMEAAEEEPIEDTVEAEAEEAVEVQPEDRPVEDTTVVLPAAPLPEVPVPAVTEVPAPVETIEATPVQATSSLSVVTAAATAAATAAIAIVAPVAAVPVLAVDDVLGATVPNIAATIAAPVTTPVTAIPAEVPVTTAAVETSVTAPIETSVTAPSEPPGTRVSVEVSTTDPPPVTPTELQTPDSLLAPLVPPTLPVPSQTPNRVIPRKTHRRSLIPTLGGGPLTSYPHLSPPVRRVEGDTPYKRRRLNGRASMSSGESSNDISGQEMEASSSNASSSNTSSSTGTSSSPANTSNSDVSAAFSNTNSDVSGAFSNAEAESSGTSVDSKTPQAPRAPKRRSTQTSYREIVEETPTSNLNRLKRLRVHQERTTRDGQNETRDEQAIATAVARKLVLQGLKRRKLISERGSTVTAQDDSVDGSADMTTNSWDTSVGDSTEDHETEPRRNQPRNTPRIRDENFIDPLTLASEDLGSDPESVQSQEPSEYQGSPERRPVRRQVRDVSFLTENTDTATDVNDTVAEHDETGE